MHAYLQTIIINHSDNRYTRDGQLDMYPDSIKERGDSVGNFILRVLLHTRETHIPQKRAV